MVQFAQLTANLLALSALGTMFLGFSPDILRAIRRGIFRRPRIVGERNRALFRARAAVWGVTVGLVLLILSGMCFCVAGGS
ncbi:MAG: hypothetical protein AAF517_22535 [Planctomycetota bacterium]